MNRIARVCAMGLLLGFAGMSTGCLVVAAGAAGAGTVAYVEGASTGIVKATPPAALVAAKAAFDDMDIYITSQDSSKTYAELVGKTSDDTNITVQVHLKAKGVSDLSVRVGIFGDRDLSDTIFAHIQDHLKAKE